MTEFLGVVKRLIFGAAEGAPVGLNVGIVAVGKPVGDDVLGVLVGVSLGCNVVVGVPVGELVVGVPVGCSVNPSTCTVRSAGHSTIWGLSLSATLTTTEQVAEFIDES